MFTATPPFGNLANNSNTVFSRSTLALSGNAIMTTHPGSVYRGHGFGWNDNGDVYIGTSDWEYGIGQSAQTIAAGYGGF